VITGKTQLLGVIGDPIAHSLSPLMHNAAIAHLGVDYIYVPFAIPSSDLTAAVRGFEAIGVRGFNITIPHKQAILPLLTEVTAVARAVGAVNTVWRTAAGWVGTNTDVEGFLAPLRALTCDWGQTSAVILGNGGAARAVVAGCAQLGCAEVHVIGRDASKLDRFAQSFIQSGQDSAGGVTLQVHLWDQLSTVLPRAGLLVNTTPIGMSSLQDMPIGSPLDLAEMALLPLGSVVYDLIYVPNPTLLLQQAQARGLMTIDGLEMLVQQGAAALTIWLERSVPVTVMRHTLQRHLGWIE
jgi:shikimate dehydrogenase